MDMGKQGGAWKWMEVEEGQMVMEKKERKKENQILIRSPLS